jgi:KUP system potassium uptake protein
VEGLKVATPALERFVVPITILILIGLFSAQRLGTGKVGNVFGPVMVVWFMSIAALGLAGIRQAPEVLAAFNPWHGFQFLLRERMVGFIALGAVFLVVTGGEALYADMGHFGIKPIRRCWFGLVLPALMLNYLGQGALLLHDSTATENPFYRLAPAWALYPLVGLATAAAVIASQALISGAFSLTRQAIQLGYAPRLDIAHTSSLEMGQVYVPQVNWGMAVATICIVIGFGSSSALAAAYGIAVTMTMVITALLLHVVATERWGWPRWATLAVTAVFLTVDLAFFGANIIKVMQGGWLPLVIATLLFTLMTTWKTGRRLVAERLTARATPVDVFMASLKALAPARVHGTAVFMTAQPIGTPPALVHNVRYNKVLHDHVVILTVSTARRPYVPLADQVGVESLGHGLYNVKLQYGFMQDPDVPEALMHAIKLGLELDPGDVTFFLGRETIIVTKRHGMAIWRERLFVLMARNAVRATAFFRLPPERVVELGVQVEM